MLIDFCDKKIHVEIYGEGEPIVLLNGIMMSTKSWTPFIKSLEKNNKIILLDFLDQGQSSKMTKDFEIEIQADVVREVIKQLGLEKVNIAGISYGGSVSLQFAIKYPELVNKLVLFNTVSHTSDWLSDIGDAWKGARISPETYYNVTIPAVYAMRFYNDNHGWMESRKKFLVNNVFNNEKFLDSMDRLTDSSKSHDVRNRLHEINAKTLVVSGREDFLTPFCEQQYISEKIPNATHITIENCGHGTMYEKPESFLTLLLGFVNSDFDVEIL